MNKNVKTVTQNANSAKTETKILVFPANKEEWEEPMIYLKIVNAKKDTTKIQNPWIV